MTSPAPNPEDSLACDLSALTPAERSRHYSLWERVREISSQEQGGTGSVVFRMPKDRELAKELAELAVLEQLCCPFLQIAVTLEPNDGQMLLELTGDAKVRAFLSEVGLLS